MISTDRPAQGIASERAEGIITDSSTRPVGPINFSTRHSFGFARIDRRTGSFRTGVDCENISERENSK